jgi:UDP-N-acetylmuramoyl-tripeptide--D-alanyl-D-alanine ligase
VTARGFSVIDDTYNANPASVQAAIQTLRALEGYRVLILGEMAELGSEGAALHREVGILAAAAGVECLLTVGSQSGLATEAYLDEGGGRGRAFASKKDLYEWLGRELTSQMVLLVKGSRSARMEEVVKMLIEEGNR